MSCSTLSDLEVVWPTRSRTGSQFVLQLTFAVCGDIQPQSRISGARREGHKPQDKSGDFWDLFQHGEGYQYLAANRIRGLKFEDPGKDDFVAGLLELAPNARFVASYRPLESVIESHYNITKWGHPEADVLYQFSACLTLYERLAATGRLFILNVDQPHQFNLQAFANFLGHNPSDKAKALAEAWTPVNTLRYQVEKSGAQYQGRRRAPRLDRIREIHDWISDYEARYQALCEKSNLR